MAAEMPPGRKLQQQPVVKILQGFQPLHDVVETGGMDLELEVQLKKTVQSYDWKMIFALYDVPFEASLVDWVKAYKENSDRCLLDRMFSFLVERQISASCRVTISIQSGDRLKLRLGARVLRMQLNGEHKDATLLNAANIVALTADGTPYNQISVHCS
ncbi:hypothetical protein ACQP1W_31560 [Spirillospora sp. CA-255316]